MSKSNAWQMGEGVGECLDGCAIAIKEEGPITARARRVCWMWMVDLEACTRITLPSHSLPALYTTSTSNKLNC